MQLGEAALVRVALHAPLDGPLVLGSVLAGTFDFRASQGASSSGSASPKCIQVWPLSGLTQHMSILPKEMAASGVECHVTGLLAA